MTISSDEAAQIRADHASLKEEVSKVVTALHENTVTTREMLLEMRERDVRDEYREKEFAELKEAIKTTNAQIAEYIKDKEPYLEWAKKRKEFNEALFAGITSTWGKFAGALIIVAIAAILGLDISKVFK